MSTNLKEILEAAQPFTETNDLVAYMTNMLKFYEQELIVKIQFMRTRMDILQNVVDGCEGYSYQQRSDISKLGMEMDIIQANVFEMTCTLVIVLDEQCGLEIEW